MPIKSYRELYTSRVPEALSDLGWDVGYLIKKYHMKSYTQAHIWLSGVHWPRFDLLLEIAKKSKTNLEYLLGATVVDEANVRYKPNIKLDELLESVNMTREALAEKINTSIHTVNRYAKNPEPLRINTLFAIADACDVSIDYLCGLTNFRHWNTILLQKDPFALTSCGQAVYIDIKVKTRGGAPINFPNGVPGYALLAKNGESILFPDGTMIDKTDNIFTKCNIMPLDIPNESI